MKSDWEITLPSQPSQGFWNHNDDSFRELALEWGNENYCKIIRTPVGNCWFGQPPFVML